MVNLTAKQQRFVQEVVLDYYTESMEFEKTLKQYSIYKKWAEIVRLIPSSRSESIIHSFGSLPGLQRTKGSVPMTDLAEKDIKIKNDDFKRGIPINVNDVDDNETLNSNDIAASLAEAAKQWAPELIIELILNGETEKSYDGEYFFGNNHNLENGTYDNLLSGNLSMDTFKNAIAEMMLFPTDIGKKKGIEPTHLIVGPLNLAPALEICKSVIIPEANKSFNNIYQGYCEPIVVPEMGTSLDWILVSAVGNSKSKKAPFIMQIRKDPKLIVDYKDFDEKDQVYFYVKARGERSYFDPRRAIKYKSV